MQNIFIDVLPPWVETGLQPAFYDLESGTVLQQTARMYAKVRELGVAFNTFTENVTNEVNSFENNVNETVADYIEKFNQLHDYVHDYFDNLDVQEEINNKLDDMAESGELTEIIAQYLSLGAVNGYATLADMKLAENLVEGSICKVLATDSNYKVRAKTPSDTADDYFIVDLYDNTLVAERVSNETLQRRFYLGAFYKQISESNKRIHLFLSDDATNFTRIPNIEIHGGSSSGGGDPSIIYDEGTGYFLIAYSNQDTIPTVQCFTIMRSKDLIHWTEHPITLTLPPSIQGHNKWSPDFFRDENGDLFVIFSADKTVLPENYDFEGLITQCTDVENLTFTNPYIINIDEPADNMRYDYSIAYFNEKYYMVASDRGIIKLYTSTDLENFTEVNNNLFRNSRELTLHELCEGCNLTVINGKLYVYTEYHSTMHRYAVSEIDTTTNDIVLPMFINSLQAYKHGSVIELNNPNEIGVVNHVGKTVINSNALTPMNYSKLVIQLSEDTTISEFTILPNQMLLLNGNGHSLTIDKIRDPYKIYKLQFVIYDGNGTLNIGGYEDDQYSAYTYVGNIPASHKLKTVDFTYNAFDNSYDYLTAGINGSIPINNTGMTGTVKYRQFGRVVNMFIDVTLSSDIAVTTLICAIPTAIKPVEKFEFPLVNKSHRTAYTTGAVTATSSELYLNQTQAGEVVGSITYMID